MRINSLNGVCAYVCGVWVVVILPRRSGPKRLGHERCGVALTTPSPQFGPP